MAYPSTILNNTNPTGSDLLTSPDHASLHSTINTDVTALEQKLGLGAGTPTANKILYGVGNGTSSWSAAGTGVTFVNSTFNNGTLGTALIVGGTINNALLGTAALNGGVGTSVTFTTSTFNNGTLGTVAQVGGTTTAVHSVTRTIGSAVYPGTVNTTITLNLAAATRHLITMPNSAGSVTLAVSNVTANQPFLVEVLQGTAGNGTVNWFSTVSWLNNGTAAPTQGTTASRKATYGFIATGAAAFDGYLVGNAG